MEVIHISGLINVNDSMAEAHTQTALDTEMTVHNIQPQFPSAEALDKKKKEIADTLYRIFSKYD